MPKDPIDVIVCDFIHPPLRASSFTRRARVWNRQRGRLTDVVSLQASRWNEGSGGRFTVNLGLLEFSVYETCWQKPPPRLAREEDCLIRTRLCDGLAEDPYANHDEQWWTVESPSDVRRVGELVARLLMTNAIPFLNRVDSLAAIDDMLEHQSGWQANSPLTRIYHAIVKADLDDPVAAHAILDDVERTSGDAWRARIATVRDDLWTGPAR